MEIIVNEPTQDVIDTRIKLAKETWELYRLEDGSLNPETWSYDHDRQMCRYEGPDGRRCAVGRLGPDKPWHEGHRVSDTDNIPLALEVAREQGIHSGNDNETLSWMRILQQIHDSEEVETARAALDWTTNPKSWETSIWVGDLAWGEYSET